MAFKSEQLVDIEQRFFKAVGIAQPSLIGPKMPGNDFERDLLKEQLNKLMDQVVDNYKLEKSLYHEFEYVLPFIVVNFGDTDFEMVVMWTCSNCCY